MIKKVAVVVYKISNNKPLFFVAKRNVKDGGTNQFVTGHLERGEDFIEAAERELYEELGEVRILNIYNLNKKNIFSSDSGKKYLEETYAAEIDEVRKLQKSEFSSFQWLEKDEAISRVCWQSHKEAIRLAAERLRAGNYPKIFIISGPSGSGKDTIINALLKDDKLKLEKSRTATTRARRQGETNERIFVNRGEFDRLYKSHRLIEKNEFNGEWYGASRDELIKVLSSNHNAIMEIDINGAISFKKEFSNVIAIFLEVDQNFLKTRLLERGSEDADAIASRLSIAKIELQKSSICDYIVENRQGAVEEAIEEIKKIIKKEIS